MRTSFSLLKVGGGVAVVALILITVVALQPNATSLLTSPIFRGVVPEGGYTETEAFCLELSKPCVAACPTEAGEETEACMAQCELDFDTCLTEDMLNS